MSKFSDKLRGVDVTNPDDIDVICNGADEIDRLVAMLETQDKQMTAQSCEGGIKDRALNVAIRELNNWAGFVADYLIDNKKNKDILEDIGRTLDQCRNARHGKLSTDPWPEIVSEGLDHD